MPPGIALRCRDLAIGYPDRRVALQAYRCTARGTPEVTGADARWVTLDECRALPIPAANPPLLDAFAWIRARG